MFLDLASVCPALLSGAVAAGRSARQGGANHRHMLPLLVENLVQGALVRRVDTINVSELVRDHAVTALAVLSKKLTAHHQAEIRNEAIEAAVEQSLSLAGPLPDKAITQ
jgi:hypothetical protein